MAKDLQFLEEATLIPWTPETTLDLKPQGTCRSTNKKTINKKTQNNKTNKTKEAATVPEDSLVTRTLGFSDQSPDRKQKSRGKTSKKHPFNKDKLRNYHLNL